MREIATEIEIAATPAHVWDLLVDFPSYPTWNPFMTKIAGDVIPGARLHVHIRPPGRAGMTFRPIVRVADRGRALSWHGRVLVPGLFDGEHTFELVPIGAGTLLRQSERFTGLLVSVLGSGLYDATRRGFEAMNVALKVRAET